MTFLAIRDPNFLLISTKLQPKNTGKARQARKQGVFRKISLRKLDMGFSRQRLEKLDFLRTNKLNGFNYHYYSLLLSSDNGWELNFHFFKITQQNLPESKKDNTSHKNAIKTFVSFH